MLSDRIAMAHSLEVRVPFVDHVMVDAIYPLPDRLKIGLGRQKRLLRRALRSRLPKAHFRAPKRGFVGPTAAWLRGEIRGMLIDHLSESRMDRLGHFEPGAISSLVNDHLSRRHNREGILWALLCFSTWHRLFIETSSVPAYRP
jgi:asparagine synthase (glutamine-hydrolysing)